MTGEFPAQMASNVENASIWWHHHGVCGYVGGGEEEEEYRDEDEDYEQQPDSSVSLYVKMVV